MRFSLRYNNLLDDNKKSHSYLCIQKYLKYSFTYSNVKDSTYKLVISDKQSQHHFKYRNVNIRGRYWFQHSKIKKNQISYRFVYSTVDDESVYTFCKKGINVKYHFKYKNENIRGKYRFRYSGFDEIYYENPHVEFIYPEHKAYAEMLINEFIYPLHEALTEKSNVFMPIIWLREACRYKKCFTLLSNRYSNMLNDEPVKILGAGDKNGYVTLGLLLSHLNTVAALFDKSPGALNVLGLDQPIFIVFETEGETSNEYSINLSSESDLSHESNKNAAIGKHYLTQLYNQMKSVIASLENVLSVYDKQAWAIACFKLENNHCTEGLVRTDDLFENVKPAEGQLVSSDAVIAMKDLTNMLNDILCTVLSKTIVFEGIHTRDEQFFRTHIKEFFADTKVKAYRKSIPEILNAIKSHMSEKNSRDAVSGYISYYLEKLYRDAVFYITQCEAERVKTDNQIAEEQYLNRADRIEKDILTDFLSIFTDKHYLPKDLLIIGNRLTDKAFKDLVNTVCIYLYEKLQGDINSMEDSDNYLMQYYFEHGGRNTAITDADTEMLPDDIRDVQVFVKHLLIKSFKTALSETFSRFVKVNGGYIEIEKYKLTEHDGGGIEVDRYKYIEPELIDILISFDILSSDETVQQIYIQNEHELNLWQRFWFLYAGDICDRKILPCHDFPYNEESIEFTGFEDLIPENYQVVYPETFWLRVDHHPVPEGSEMGTREIPLAINIMIDVINILILMWHRFYPAFWGWTGTQAVLGITGEVYKWLILESSINEQDNKTSREQYERCYRWLRWEAEKVALLARNDMELRGNYYVGILLEELINYMLNHHFDVMPIFTDVHKMDEWRRVFKKDLQQDITWVLEKVKGIRHKLITGRERQYNA